MSKTGFVFVHGAWHGAGTWDEITPRLEARGFALRTLDLPGAGANAKSPDAFHRRPLDSAAFGTEPSPNAAVTQEERTAAVIAEIDALRAAGVDRVVLAGHSLGGLTVSAVAEAAPEKLAGVVYLTAFMLPPGMPAIAMIQHEKMKGEKVAELFMSDPAQTGALRLDVASDDPGYRAGLKTAFYGDLNEAQFEIALKGLHCDEPAGVALEPSPITPQRFGSLPRHYIRCTKDMAILPAGQDFMIEEVDKAMGNSTQVHTLEASHSPFYSKPDELASLLTAIAGQG